MSNPRTPTDFKAKTIVLLGDGPMALIAAVYLKNMGVQDITVVGPHLGEFHRSGDFHREVFPAVSNALNISIIPTNSRHIKDVERQVYEHAQTAGLGITFIKQKFLGFERDRKIRVSNTGQMDEKMGDEQPLLRFLQILFSIALVLHTLF